MELLPDIALLATTLREIEGILSEDETTAWVEQIKICRTAIENSDQWGADRFLGYFGGMGSLNDYYVQKDGKPAVAETDRLHELLSEAWTLARALRA